MEPDEVKKDDHPIIWEDLGLLLTFLSVVAIATYLVVTSFLWTVGRKPEKPRLNYSCGSEYSNYRDYSSMVLIPKDTLEIQQYLDTLVASSTPDTATSSPLEIENKKLWKTNTCLQTAISEFNNETVIEGWFEE